MKKIKNKLLVTFVFVWIFPYLPLFYVPSFIQYFFAGVGGLFYYFVLFLLIIVFFFISLIKKKLVTIFIILLMLEGFFVFNPILKNLDNEIIILWNSKKNVENFTSPIVGIKYEKKCLNSLRTSCFIWGDVFSGYDSLVYSPNHNMQFFKENYYEQSEGVVNIFDDNWYEYQYIN